MQFLASIVLLLATSCAQTGVILPTDLTELYLIRLRIELLTQKLHEKCPDLVDHGMFIGKREINDRLPHKDTMQIEHDIYNHIQSLLEQCHSKTLTERNRDVTEIESTPNRHHSDQQQRQPAHHRQDLSP